VQFPHAILPSTELELAATAARIEHIYGTILRLFLLRSVQDQFGLAPFCSLTAARIQKCDAPHSCMQKQSAVPPYPSVSARSNFAAETPPDLETSYSAPEFGPNSYNLGTLHAIRSEQAMM
jgi:hypothetical protein